jgi:hypothetical protein
VIARARWRYSRENFGSWSRNWPRYVDAIGQGGWIPVLVGKMQQRERKRSAIEAELEHLASLSRTANLRDRVVMTAELRALCTEWQDLLRTKTRRPRTHCCGGYSTSD